MNEKEYYISTKNKINNKEFDIYCSDQYKLSEDELLKVLKVLITDRRLVRTGKKILKVYLEYNENSIDCKNKLEKIYIKYDRPTTTKQNRKI